MSLLLCDDGRLRYRWVRRAKIRARRETFLTPDNRAFDAADDRATLAVCNARSVVAILLHATYVDPGRLIRLMGRGCYGCDTSHTIARACIIGLGCHVLTFRLSQLRTNLVVRLIEVGLRGA